MDGQGRDGDDASAAVHQVSGASGMPTSRLTAGADGFPVIAVEGARTITDDHVADGLLADDLHAVVEQSASGRDHLEATTPSRLLRPGLLDVEPFAEQTDDLVGGFGHD